MPGYADYKRLYKEEFKTLYDEGFDPYKYINNDKDSKDFCPDPTDMDKYPNGDDFWKLPYENLCKVMDTPIREGYPYVEPNDFEAIMKEAIPCPELLPLGDEEYKERLYGAFYGRCAAVILGKPLEMGLKRQFIKEYLESVGEYPLNDYISARSEKLNYTLREDCIYSTKDNVKFAQSDDDINYTLLGLRLIEKYGLNIEPWMIGDNWANNIPYYWCWCASRVAYYHLITNDVPAERIPYSLNPWRECIDGQIRTDIWGYVFPAKHYEACKYAHLDTSFSLTKNGIYGGMFVAGALSCALSKNPTADKIIDAGLASIPQRSRLYEAITDVRAWYKESGDFTVVCDKIVEKYNLPNEATINNMSVVALGIIAGELDYTKSITVATMCGLDTDCNAGTVGSIVGAAVGLSGIEKRWYEPLNDTIKSVVADIGECRISDICERIIRAKEKVYNL